MTSPYPGVDLATRSNAGMNLWTQVGPATPGIDAAAGLLPPARVGPGAAAAGRRGPELAPVASTRAPATDETALRAGASLAELDVKQQTYEGVERAIRESGAAVRPHLVDLQRVYRREPARDTDENERVAERRQEAYERIRDAAREFRVAASRLYAIRMALADQAARAADAVNRDAQALADENRRLAEGGRDAAARAASVERQGQLVASLSRLTGALPQRRPDGSVALELDGALLVDGPRAARILIEDGSERPAPAATPTTPGAPGPDAPHDAAPGANETAPGDRRVASTGPDAAEPPQRRRPPQPAPPAGPGVSSGDAVRDSGTGSPAPATTPPPPVAHPTWPDGTPVRQLGGILGGALTSAEGILGAAIARLDGVAARFAQAVNGAQAAGTNAAGSPAPPLLTGASAWDLALALAAAPGDVALPGSPRSPEPSAVGLPATGPGSPPPGFAPPAETLTEQPPGPTGPLPSPLPPAAPGPTESAPGVVVVPGELGPDRPDATQPASPAGFPPGPVARPGPPAEMDDLVDDPAGPAALVDALAGDARALGQAVSRRSLVLGRIDALVAEPAGVHRVGRHVSELLGAVAAPSGSGGPPTVQALQALNAAVVSLGTVAKGAAGGAVPLLVGSSDPRIVTGAGALPPPGSPAAAGGGLPPGPGGASVLSVEVDALAEPGRSTSSRVFAAGEVLGAGEPFTLGIVSGVGVPGAEATTLVTLPGGATLADVAAAINAAPAGARASVGAAGPGAEQLEVVSAATGRGSGVTVTDGAEPPGASSALGPFTEEAGGGDTVVRASTSGGAPLSFTSPTPLVSGVVPGLDLTVHRAAPGGAVTLTLTPDPTSALNRAQALLDGVAAVGALTASSAPPPPGGFLGGLRAAVSAGSSPATSMSPTASMASGLAQAATPGARDEAVAVGRAVGAAIDAALVDSGGRPLLPGVTKDRDGRYVFDREQFGRAYVRDAHEVESALTRVSASLGEVVKEASDPRTGVLPVRIVGEQAMRPEYTVTDAGVDERLGYREEELQRRSEALQTLLERLEGQRDWLTAQVP